MAVTLGCTLAAPPASAGSPGPLSRAAATRAARANLNNAVAQDAPATTSSGRSFFRTGKGVAALVLFAAGLGYTIHSRSDDRVKSQIR